MEEKDFNIYKRSHPKTIPFNNLPKNCSPVYEAGNGCPFIDQTDYCFLAIQRRMAQDGILVQRH